MRTIPWVNGFVSSLAFHSAVFVAFYALYSSRAYPTEPIYFSYIKTTTPAPTTIVTPPAELEMRKVGDAASPDEEGIQAQPAKPNEAVVVTKKALIVGKPPIVSAPATAKKAVPAPKPPPNVKNVLTKKPVSSWVTSPASQAQYMTDPHKGKIFLNYFGGVKERIHRTLREKYEKRKAGFGRVTLSFVLNSDGSLKDVAVNEKKSDADSAIKLLAVECLKAAAPFSAFPQDIDSKELVFDVVVLFEQT